MEASSQTDTTNSRMRVELFPALTIASSWLADTRRWADQLQEKNDHAPVADCSSDGDSADRVDAELVDPSSTVVWPVSGINAIMAASACNNVGEIAVHVHTRVTRLVDLSLTVG
jgi:hypothetical protein